MQNDVIGSAEAAGLLRIDRSTLTRWVKASRLTPVMRGTGATGEMFFNRADIDALRPPERRAS